MKQETTLQLCNHYYHYSVSVSDGCFSSFSCAFDSLADISISLLLFLLLKLFSIFFFYFFRFLLLLFINISIYNMYDIKLLNTFSYIIATYNTITSIEN